MRKVRDEIKEKCSYQAAQTLLVTTKYLDWGEIYIEGLTWWRSW